MWETIDKWRFHLPKPYTSADLKTHGYFIDKRAVARFANEIQKYYYIYK